MSEKKTKITLPNLGEVDGTEVPITESTDRWTDIKLEDGSVLRMKPVVMSVMRIDNQYDQEGNPLYAIRSSNAMAVVSTPAHLRRGGTKSKSVQ